MSHYRFAYFLASADDLGQILITRLNGKSICRVQNYVIPTIFDHCTKDQAPIANAGSCIPTIFDHRTKDHRHLSFRRHATTALRTIANADILPSSGGNDNAASLQRSSHIVPQCSGTHLFLNPPTNPYPRVNLSVNKHQTVKGLVTGSGSGLAC